MWHRIQSHRRYLDVTPELIAISGLLSLVVAAFGNDNLAACIATATISLLTGLDATFYIRALDHHEIQCKDYQSYLTVRIITMTVGFTLAVFFGTLWLNPKLSVGWIVMGGILTSSTALFAFVFYPGFCHYQWLKLRLNEGEKLEDG